MGKAGDNDGEGTEEIGIKGGQPVCRLGVREAGDGVKGSVVDD